MSYVFYNPNDLVYVSNIGYGKLVNCGKFNSVSVKAESRLNQPQEEDVFYFDPRLFLLPGETMDYYVHPLDEQKEKEITEEMKEKERDREKEK